ncbi:Uncharacterised protein [Bordetella pertussis]|nr:Uncharacterised protein [Bordetella pertussis]CPJ21592.1 Uncharacterised protein [Bordetella pertussis]CRE17893.1 Uncharacterised protein [Bordetella pertussis]
MHATDAQGIHRHQAAHAATGAGGRRRVLLASRRRRRLVEIVGFAGGQPRNALTQLQAHVTDQGGHVAAEAAYIQGLQALDHGDRQRIVAVDDGQARRLEDAGLGLRIGLHVAMPVEVVLGHVQHDRGVGRQRPRGFQLEAGEFQHPHLRQIILVQRIHQRGQRGGADIAGRARAHPACLDQLPGQRGDGGLAIGASDRQHARTILSGFGQAGQRAGEQLDLAHHFHVALTGLLQQFAGRRLVRHQSRAQHDLRHTVEQVRGELLAAAQPVFDRGIGQRRLQRGQPSRLRARVRHAQGRTLAGVPARGGHARLAQSEDQDKRCGGTGGFSRIHRNFSVERPTSTSIMVMIQNRTTTWVSFQPPTSKW